MNYTIKLQDQTGKQVFECQILRETAYELFNWFDRRYCSEHQTGEHGRIYCKNPNTGATTLELGLYPGKLPELLIFMEQALVKYPGFLEPSKPDISTDLPKYPDDQDEFTETLLAEIENLPCPMELAPNEAPPVPTLTPGINSWYRTLLNFYREGWNDCSDNKPPKEIKISLFKTAYDIGYADFLAGDEITSVDLQTEEQIINHIYQIYVNGR